MEEQREAVEKIRARTPKKCGCAGCVTARTLLNYISVLEERIGLLDA